MAGMTLASIVCGNTVVLKPSSDSPTIAAKFVDLLEECWHARRRSEFLSWWRASFGDALVAPSQGPLRGLYRLDARSDCISTSLRRRSNPGQIWIKRTILEMGGKDAIIVDSDADIDSAVEGVAQAAFGFQGQKCSACSRAIIDERIYDKFLEKLKTRVERITVGDPVDNPGMAAVINEGSMNDILRYIEIGKKEGRLLTGGARATQRGRWLLHSADGDCGHPAEVETRTGRNFRTGAGGDQGAQFRSRDGDCERHRVRPDGRSLFQFPRKARSRGPRIPCRQPLPEP